MSAGLMKYVIEDVGQDCPLCQGKRGKQAKKAVFRVSGPGYSGEICGDHLAILVAQNGKKHESPSAHQ